MKANASPSTRIGQQVGQEAEHDQGRRNDRLPDRAQRLARVKELDEKKGQQREPGKARGGRQTAEQPRKQPALPSRREHRAERERAEEGFRITDQQEVGGREDDKEGSRPKGGVLPQVLTRTNRRPFHTGGGCDLIQQDGGDHARDIADQQRGGTGRQAGRGDGTDQGGVEGEEGDQVACIAGRAVTVGGQVEVVLRVPVVPGAPEGSQGIGAGSELGQREADQHDLDQQRKEDQAQPGPDSIGSQPHNWKSSGSIATQRPTGRRAE